MAQPPGRLSGRGPCHPGEWAGGRAQKALEVVAAAAPAPWGSITLDLLGDGALKLSKLPDHWRCYKGRRYVNCCCRCLHPVPGPRGVRGVGEEVRVGGWEGLCVTSKGQVFTVVYAKPLQEEQSQRAGRPPAERKRPSLQINSILSSSAQIKV